MKRFYKDVSVVEEPQAGYGVHLDGRPVRTPLRAPLSVPGQTLAAAIGDEWDRQGEQIELDTMPFTRIAATAIDRASGKNDAFVGQIAAYAETDLVCYRAPSPQTLVLRQTEAWEPLLDWSHREFGVRLAATEGVSPLDQDPDVLAGLSDVVRGHNPFELAALGVATSASGSLVIALALSRSHIDAARAFEISQLDESFQSELWGRDDEAEARRAVLKADLEASEAFLALLRAD